MLTASPGPGPVTARRVAVFFYGLFMDAELLHAKDVDPVVVGNASIAGAALRVGQRAALVPSDAGTVHGVLMELTHADLEHLYSEPSVNLYRPEPVLALVTGRGFVPALCYNLVAAPAEEPNREYVAALRALATRLALPASYITSIGSP
jgi:hypothetical protein